MLFEAAGRGKSFATLGAGVAASTHVLGSDVSLQVAGVGEHLVAVLTWELSVRVVCELSAANKCLGYFTCMCQFLLEMCT